MFLTKYKVVRLQLDRDYQLPLYFRLFVADVGIGALYSKLHVPVFIRMAFIDFRIFSLFSIFIKK